MSGTARRSDVALLAGLSAAASVALGAIYMWVADAPRIYILVNAAALIVGVVSASLVRRIPTCNRRFAGAATVAIALLLLATAWSGVHTDGASRWVRVAGISLQPSLILQPMAMVSFARHRDWVASIGLVIASVALGTQPDRAGTLAAGLATLWLHRREPPVTTALVAAVSALAATMVAADVVAPIPFVERVVQSAFGFHVLTGLAVVVGLPALLVPAGAARGALRGDAEVFAVFGSAWVAVIAFALVGNYPTPLVGYGSSAILGYCLSCAALPHAEHRPIALKTR